MKPGINYVGVCVVYLCHDGQGNFVMNKRGEKCRDEVGKWDCGGGKLELHENIEDRLKAEIKEEYGAEVLKYERLGFTDVHRVHEDQKTHWISLDYKVLVNKEQVHNAEPYKLDEVKWFKWLEIPEDNELHSALPAWLKKYKDKFKNI
jgi:ADP-ribose pyrophosphatase YjhB (NUDIX family)